jgi:hypothetical protein
MKERRVLTKAMCERYRKARKNVKGRILDEYVEATGQTRCYARWLLRNHGRQVEVRPGVRLEGDARLRPIRKKKRIYGPEVLGPLKKLWVMTDYLCGKRLKPALPGLMERLEACKEMRFTKTVRARLLQISPATIDRLLKPERAKHTLKNRGRTKPGTLLKHQIPIRTFSDWQDTKPGFLEIDLVAHDGGVSSGDHCFTLDATDVASGWTEQAAVRNKAEMHVFAGIEALRARLPFPILGLDSDNGGEFINHHLLRYCTAEKLTFTRSRPYQKNDTCYVEQKNWSVVRRFVGYARYESEDACRVLNALYLVLRDYTNFFLPSLKLKEKTRDGAHISRHYYPARTAYQQLLQSPDVDSVIKRRLQTRYNSLNPAALHREIQRLQKKLLTLTARAAQTKKAAA